MKAPSHQLAAFDEEERKCKMVKNENVRQSAIWKTLSNIRTIWEARRGFGRLLLRGLNLVWKMALIFLMGAPARKGGGADDASNQNPMCQSHLDQTAETVVLIVKNSLCFALLLWLHLKQNSCDFFLQLKHQLLSFIMRKEWKDVSMTSVSPPSDWLIDRACQEVGYWRDSLQSV